MKILILGCGKKSKEENYARIANFIGRMIDLDKDEVITLDREEYLNPDIICNLGSEPIRLDDNSVDIVIAIHVLEHIGKQGETKEWFHFWEELYRILVPDGMIHFESPLYSSVWAWADPSHTRALSPQSFVFFSQDSYRVKPSAISPFRINCDFIPPQPFSGQVDSNETIASMERYSHFTGSLKVIKPLKVWWLDSE